MNTSRFLTPNPSNFERVSRRYVKAKAKVQAPAKVARRGKGAAEASTAPECTDSGPTNEALELGVHGTKMAHLVQRIRDTPEGERILVFVQFPDLMKQVADVLEAAKIKSLKLKGSVHQQTGALDEFQKDVLRKGDARVLLLLSRDESASGANLTSANHAIFVHPLLTTTQYEYVASETQAIGRIRRYGQTKLVKVWRFIVRDSIDAEIIKQRGEAGGTV
jgi:SNF2 family DNA or RNA helicase